MFHNYIKDYMRDNSIQFGQKCYLVDNYLADEETLGEEAYLSISPDSGHIELHIPLFEDDEGYRQWLLLEILQGVVQMIPKEKWE